MQEEKTTRTSTYREMKLGDTVFMVTSVYLGEKDLKNTLEQLTINRVLAELSTGKPA